MEETVVRGNEIPQLVADELCIDEYNSIRVFVGEDEISFDDLKVVIYEEENEESKTTEMLKCVVCGGELKEEESVDGKVYKATLSHTNVWCENGKWNYEDDSCLFIDEPLEDITHESDKKRTGKCIYCEDSKQTEDLHFACEICGDGMCDECYGQMTEHDGHYNLPLENCDSELEIKLIAEACGNDNPDYICESCMTEVMTKGKLAFIKEDLEKLVGTRWECKEDLEKHLNKTYEIDSKLKDVNRMELLNDYAFTMSIFKDWGSMDIYYLKIPYGEDTIYITKVSASED